jgi:asparagine synthetase B (glutamine-hydrolysing)
MAELPPIQKPVAYFVDQLDRLLEDFFDRHTRAAPNVALLLSGGIDSALLASYLPARTVAMTWGGWGEDTTDVLFAKKTFGRYKLEKHLTCVVDYAADEKLYHEIVPKMPQPFPLGFGAPYLRMSQALASHFQGQPFLLINGQNADTISGAFHPTSLAFKFARLNRFNPCRQLIPNASLDYKRKFFLLTSTNPIELLSFAHSNGIYPGPWLRLPKKYFESKLSQVEMQIGKKLTTFTDMILTDQLMTEARRNQYIQSSLPVFFGGATTLPYYDQNIVRLFAQVPDAIRRQQNNGKVIIQELARKRGVPIEVIEKGKKGLSYGWGGYIREKKHIPTWDAMVGSERMNEILNVAELRSARQDNFATFDLLRGLHFFLEYGKA